MIRIWIKGGVHRRHLFIRLSAYSCLAVSFYENVSLWRQHCKFYLIFSFQSFLLLYVLWFKTLSKKLVLLPAVILTVNASGLSNSDANGHQIEFPSRSDSPLLAALIYNAAARAGTLHRLRRSSSPTSRPCVKTKQWPPSRLSCLQARFMLHNLGCGNNSLVYCHRLTSELKTTKNVHYEN